MIRKKPIYIYTRMAHGFNGVNMESCAISIYRRIGYEHQYFAEYRLFDI